MKISEIVTESSTTLNEFFWRSKDPLVDRITRQLSGYTVEQLASTAEYAKNKLLKDMTNLEREWKKQNVYHDTSQDPEIEKVQQVNEYTGNTTPSILQYLEPLRVASATLSVALQQLKSKGALDKLQLDPSMYQHVLNNVNKHAQYYIGKTLF